MATLDSLKILIDDLISELGKIPKSDSNITLNATALRDIAATLGGAASQLRYQQSGSGTVEEDALMQFNISLMDIDTGAIAAGSIDISGISQVMERSRGGGAFGAMTAPVFAKDTGRVYQAYQFLAADWQVGDVYRLTLSGITCTVAGATAYVPTMIWSNMVVEAQDVTSEIAKIPKSDAAVSWNATALAAILTQISTALNTIVPLNPTVGSLNDIMSKAPGANTFVKATDSLEAISEAIAALAAFLPTKTLDPANDTVAAGYYAATTLSAVDTDLATANIKATKTIFGIAGKAEVVDTVEVVAPITAADVVDPHVGFVNGAKVTGTVTEKVGSATVITPSAIDQAIPEGRYGGVVGDGKVLGDADLVTGNIKDTVDIFGVVGTYDHEAGNPITAAKLPTGDVGFVNGAKVTGNGTKTLDPAANTFAGGYYAGDAGGLSAIDTDLVTANILAGKTIFGIPGTATVKDVSDTTAAAGDVKAGTYFYTAAGVKTEGTLP
jgi:hypothetical protein